MFYRNTIKVRYCCTQNLGNITKLHNKKLISSNNQLTLPCNCRKKEKCPLEAECRANDVVCKCVASGFPATGFPNKVYLRNAKGEFKTVFQS